MKNYFYFYMRVDKAVKQIMIDRLNLQLNKD